MNYGYGRLIRPRSTTHANQPPAGALTTEKAMADAPSFEATIIGILTSSGAVVVRDFENDVLRVTRDGSKSVLDLTNLRKTWEGSNPATRAAALRKRIEGSDERLSEIDRENPDPSTFRVSVRSRAMIESLMAYPGETTIAIPLRDIGPTLCEIVVSDSEHMMMMMQDHNLESIGMTADEAFAIARSNGVPGTRKREGSRSAGWVVTSDDEYILTHLLTDLSTGFSVVGVDPDERLVLIPATRTAALVAIADEPAAVARIIQMALGADDQPGPVDLSPLIGSQATGWHLLELDPGKHPAWGLWNKLRVKQSVKSYTLQAETSGHRHPYQFMPMMDHENYSTTVAPIGVGEVAIPAADLVFVVDPEDEKSAFPVSMKDWFDVVGSDLPGEGIPERLFMEKPMTDKQVEELAKREYRPNN